MSVSVIQAHCHEKRGCCSSKADKMLLISVPLAVLLISEIVDYLSIFCVDISKEYLL